MIAWFCEEQDHDDGANHLLDSRPVVLGLSESSRRTLRMTQLECPCGTRPDKQRALDELKASLQQRAASHLIKIRLRRGDLLIIDNGRILHGRGELRSDSKRELLRAWIRRRA